MGTWRIDPISRGPDDRVSRRRDLLILLAAALVPRDAFAQSKPTSGKVWRIGFLYAGSRQLALDRISGFLQGMKDTIQGTDWGAELA